MRVSFSSQRRWPARVAMAFATFVASLGAGSVALSGPQHALWPWLHGWVQVAEGVWIDDPGQAEAAVADLARARARVTGFFDATGTAPSPPGRMILCATARCEDTLGLGVHGVAYGAHLVLISAKGLNEMILTHELSHIALHQSYSLADALSPRFPAWFDEGLAVLLSNDPRYEGLGETEWIDTAQNFRDWSRLVETHGWRAVYGAAGARVARIEGVITRAGLQELIHDVAQGGDFNRLLARRMDAAS